MAHNLWVPITIAAIVALGLFSMALLRPSDPVAARVTPNLTIRFGLPEFAGGGANPARPVEANLSQRFDRHSLAPTIKRNAKVQFDVSGFHQVAIYKADGQGALQGDIDVPPSTQTFVNDANNRIALGTVREDFDFRFSEPGTYLVICNVRSHFVDDAMYMYVTVSSPP